MTKQESTRRIWHLYNDVRGLTTFCGYPEQASISERLLCPWEYATSWHDTRKVTCPTCLKHYADKLRAMALEAERSITTATKAGEGELKDETSTTLQTNPVQR